MGDERGRTNGRRERAAFLPRSEKLRFGLKTPCFTAHFDGAAQPTNPGPAGYGLVVKAPNGATLHRSHHGLGWTTNNVAEMSGLIAALEWFEANPARRPFAIYGDSQWAVNQVTEGWAVRQEHLVEFVVAARRLCKELEAPIVWVPRELNYEADYESKLAVNGGL